MRKVVSFFGLFLLICSCFMGVSCVNNIDGVGSIVLKMPGSSSRAASPDGSSNNTGTYKIDLFCEADRSEQHLTAKAEETVVINEVRIGYCTIILTYYDGRGYAVNRGSAKVFVNKWVQNPVSIKLASFVATPEITKQPQDVTARLVSPNIADPAYISLDNIESIVEVPQEGDFSARWFWCDSAGRELLNARPFYDQKYHVEEKDGKSILTTGGSVGGFNEPGDFYCRFEVKFTKNRESESLLSRVVHIKILPEVIKTWSRLTACLDDPIYENKQDIEIYVSGTLNATQPYTSTTGYGGFDPNGKNVTIIAVDGGCTIKKKSDLNGFVFSLTGGGSLTLKGSPSSKLIIDGGEEACGSNYGLIGLNWGKNDSSKTAKLYVMENCVLQNNVNTYGKDPQTQGVAGAAIGFNIDRGLQNLGKGSEIVVKGEIINCKGQTTIFGDYDKNIIVTPYNHQVLIVK